MTTRVIISNEGPDNIEVKPGNNTASIVEPGRFMYMYVYEGNEIHIKEIKKV